MSSLYDEDEHKRELFVKYRGVYTDEELRVKLGLKEWELLYYQRIFQGFDFLKRVEEDDVV